MGGCIVWLCGSGIGIGSRSGGGWYGIVVAVAKNLTNFSYLHHHHLFLMGHEKARERKKREV